MGIVRSRAAEPPPTDQATRPITLTSRLLIHERPKLHRLCPLPAAVGIPVIGYAGIGATPGTRQNKKTRVPIDEIL